LHDRLETQVDLIRTLEQEEITRLGKVPISPPATP
jgi:hypothetical protein